MPSGETTDFSQAILEEARQEANGILDMAKREADLILEEARKELQQVYSADSPEAARRIAKTRYKNVVAAAELDARKQALLTQERLIAEVFAQVQHRLSNVRNEPRYPELLSNLIRKGIAELAGEAFEVIADPQDRMFITDAMLKQLARDIGKTLTLSEESRPDMTGCIIRRTDRHVQCDNSFQAMLQRQKENLRLLVAQELFAGMEEL